MISSRHLALSLLAWLGVGVFWLLATRGYHPSWSLAAVATGSLVVAYAAASYLNHLVLIPRFLRRGRPVAYAASLLAVMVGLTAAAIAAPRSFYVHAVGLAAVNSLRLDFALDSFGRAVHVAGTALVAWLFGKFTRRARRSRGGERPASG